MNHGLSLDLLFNIAAALEIEPFLLLQFVQLIESYFVSDKTTS